MKRMIVLGAILLAACQPSAMAIQTAMAETQAAMPTDTSMPIPPPTAMPTATPDPCSHVDVLAWWLGAKPLWDSMYEELDAMGAVPSRSAALTYQATALARASALGQVEGPPCTEDARDALQDVFDSWARALQAFALDNSAVFQSETSATTDAIHRFGTELAELGLSTSD